MVIEVAQYNVESIGISISLTLTNVNVENGVFSKNVR